MNDRNLAFSGAALLAAGLFTPIVTMPIVGSVNLFNNGSNLTALSLLALAALAGALAAKIRLRDIIWPGSAAAAVLAYLFARLQYHLSVMRATVEKELEGNPFAGLARTATQTIQLQWGWLVLAAGAGLLIYVGLTARRQQSAVEEAPQPDRISRYIAIASLVLLMSGPGLELFRKATAEPYQSGGAAAAGAPLNSVAGEGAPSVDAAAPSREEASYIARHLRLYDLKAEYFESYEGRTPGVRFKLKNSGNRTLNRVDVRVVFLDNAGQPIGEEEYSPVLVSEYSFGGDNTPLRPNYIWQQEPNRFFTAKSIPTEWAEGRATATITSVEFAPEGARGN